MFTRSESVVSDGGSASTVCSETVTGWYVLKVEGFSKFKGIGVGQREESRTFIFCDRYWRISFFPDGFSHGTADWICVELDLRHPDTDVKTSLRLCLLDQFGEPVEPYSINAEWTFTAMNKSSFRYPRFIRKEDLESSFLKEDSFQIRCDITIANVIRTRAIPIECTSSSATPPMTDLQQNLGDLLASKVIGGDVTFEVNGELFTAHRNVLAARSSVFKAEFFGPMKEKQTEHILIQDTEPRVFKIMLQFIYTDSLPMKEIEADERSVIAQHLFVAADRYNLQRLKSICVEMLCCSVDISTAATTLVLAEQHACKRLKNACFEFLKRKPGNLKAVLASDGFQHLKTTCPSLVKEIRTRIKKDTRFF